MGSSVIGFAVDVIAVALCTVMGLKLGEVVFYGSRTYPLTTIRLHHHRYDRRPS